jgi:hypothetical protein
MAAKLMDSVLENSINQGLKHNLKNAMSGAGVNVDNNTGLWQYPEIIRNKMAINTVNGINLAGKDCIKITPTVENDIITYEISTIIDSHKLERPEWVNENNKWDNYLTVQSIFDDLFSNILPTIRGVYAGDMTSSDYDGNDTKEWKHELFGVSGRKTGLKQSSRYLRLYLTSQYEPLYIHTGSYVEEITGGYNVADSDTVRFIVDDKNQKLTAHINIITDEQLEQLKLINNTTKNNT